MKIGIELKKYTGHKPGEYLGVTTSSTTKKVTLQLLSLFETGDRPS
jgi:hypothetical protein